MSDTPTARPELSPLITISEDGLAAVTHPDMASIAVKVIARELDAQRAAAQRQYDENVAQIVDRARLSDALARTQAEREALREALKRIEHMAARQLAEPVDRDTGTLVEIHDVALYALATEALASDAPDRREGT
jgi:hypothetical protein